MSDQLQFCEPPVEFNVKAWLEFGRELLKHDAYVRGTNRCMQWDIGDWLIEGEDNTGKKKKMKVREFKQLAAQTTGYGWSTLKNMMWISRQVEESRRRDGREGRRYLDYNIHVAVAKFDGETQERLLSEAESAWAWSHTQKTDAEPLTINDIPVKFSVRAFQDYIAVKQEKGELPKTFGQKRPSKAAEGHYVKVWLKNENYEQIRCLTLGKGGGIKFVKVKDNPNELLDIVDEEAVGRLIYDLARRCLNENKDEYKPLYVAGKKKMEQMKKDAEEKARIKRICDGVPLPGDIRTPTAEETSKPPLRPEDIPTLGHDHYDPANDPDSLKPPQP